jgi:hypothetical protein
MVSSSADHRSVPEATTAQSEVPGVARTITLTELETLIGGEMKSLITSSY